MTNLKNQVSQSLFKFIIQTFFVHVVDADEQKHSVSKLPKADRFLRNQALNQLFDNSPSLDLDLVLQDKIVSMTQSCDSQLN